MKHTIYIVLWVGLTAVTSMTGQPNDKSIYEKEIDAVLSSMTLEEKCSMMQGGEPDQGTYHHHESKRLERVGIPAMSMANGPMGVKNDVLGGYGEPHTSFGSGLILASTWNTELIRDAGWVLGQESLAKNVGLFEAPGINILRDLLGGRCFEYYSEDPYLNAQVVIPYVQGVQYNRVAANTKHFVVNNQDENRGRYSSHVSERALHEIYLPAFKSVTTDADCWSFMTAANRYNGTYISDNRYLMTNLMKYQWGMRGLILTDWCNTRSDIQAARGGLDLAMTYRPGSKYRNLNKLVKNGQLSETIIDENVRNILRVLFLTGEMGSDAIERPAGSINTPINQQIARNVAEEGIVLLKNSDLLPLGSDVGSIAVLGEHTMTEFYRLGMGGSGSTRPPYQVTYLDGLKNKAGKAKINHLQFQQSQAKKNLKEQIDAAVALAKKSDVAVVIAGISNKEDSEGRDRKDMHFPQYQVQLIKAVVKANPKTIVVITGSSLEIESFVNEVPSIIWAGYPGMEAGNATADIIFGTINPSGKLPYTLPKKYEDTCAALTQSNDNVVYKEGVFVGYRWNDQQKIEPRYAFGHGLSYTTFAYDNVQLSTKSFKPDETITVSVDLKNTGNVAGKEVVQLYVHDVASSVERPLKELKAFEKVALAPGEMKTVTLSLDQSAWSFWDVNTHSFIAEKGEFELWVGGASDDIRLRAKCALSESSLPDPDMTVYQAEKYASVKKATVAHEPTGYTGEGYLVMEPTGSAATWTIKITEADTYSIIVKYAAEKNKPCKVVVDGKAAGSLFLSATTYLSTWNYESVDVELGAGEHTLELAANSAAGGPNVDSIIIQRINIPTPAMPTEHTYPTPGISPSLESILSAEEFAKVKLQRTQARTAPFSGPVIEGETFTYANKAKADNKYKGFSGDGYLSFGPRGSWVEWNLIVPTFSPYTLNMRYAAAGKETRICKVVVNGNEAGTIEFKPTGKPGTWKTVDKTIELDGGENSVRIVVVSKSGGPYLDKIEISGGMVN